MQTLQTDCLPADPGMPKEQYTSIGMLRKDQFTNRLMFTFIPMLMAA